MSSIPSADPSTLSVPPTLSISCSPSSTSPPPPPLASSSAPSPLHLTYDTEQDRLMGEEVILVDVGDRPLGSASKRVSHLKTSIADGMLHRAFSVFLFNSSGHLLLQQRAAAKITFPNRWTNTCCSHPLYGGKEMEEEEARGVKRAAIRKLEHELGIELEEKDLVWLTKIHYKSMSDSEWGEHEVDWILFAQKDVQVKMNENEVQAVEYVSIERLKEMFQEQTQGKLVLTPWFHLIAEKLLYGWWEKLGQVLKEKGIGPEEKKKIHYLTF